MDSVATFCGLAPSQEWKKGDVVFVLQYPLHGRDLVVYCHQDSIFWKRKFRMIFLDIRQDVSNTGFLWKPDLNLVTLGFRPLQPQEGNRYVHSFNLADQFFCSRSLQSYLRILNPKHEARNKSEIQILKGSKRANVLVIWILVI